MGVGMVWSLRVLLLYITLIYSPILFSATLFLKFLDSFLVLFLFALLFLAFLLMLTCLWWIIFLEPSSPVFQPSKLSQNCSELFSLLILLQKWSEFILHFLFLLIWFWSELKHPALGILKHIEPVLVLHFHVLCWVFHHQKLFPALNHFDQWYYLDRTCMVTLSPILHGISNSDSSAV